MVQRWELAGCTGTVPLPQFPALSRQHWGRLGTRAPHVVCFSQSKGSDTGSGRSCLGWGLEQVPCPLLTDPKTSPPLAAAPGKSRKHPRGQQAPPDLLTSQHSPAHQTPILLQQQPRTPHPVSCSGVTPPAPDRHPCFQTGKTSVWLGLVAGHGLTSYCPPISHLLTLRQQLAPQQPVRRSREFEITPGELPSKPTHTAQREG